jgi:hypothetical protein
MSVPIWPFTAARAGRGPTAVPRPQLVWPFGAAKREGYTAPYLPPNLIAAIVARASADPALAGISGGFWKDELPATPAGGTAPESYCVVSRAGSSLLWNLVGSVWVAERIRFRTYHADPDQAESLGESLIAAVPAWGSLDYRTGFSIPLVEAGTSSGKTAKRRSGDVGAWYSETTFTARCKRGRD